MKNAEWEPRQEMNLQDILQHPKREVTTQGIMDGVEVREWEMGIAVPRMHYSHSQCLWAKQGSQKKDASEDCVDELIRRILFNACLSSDVQVTCTYLAINFYDSGKGTVLLSFWQRRRGMLRL